jgi:hypothetical protein
MWAGYWLFVGFVFLSPLLASMWAAREYEYWPVVHPAYALFFMFPAALAAYQLFLGHPIEWGQWLAWSLVVTIALVGVLTAYLRRHIDREWAVARTLLVTLVFVGFALNVTNSSFQRQVSQIEFVSVVHAAPGGYRQGGPRLTVELEGGERRTFFVGWGDYLHWQDGRAVCVC